MGPSMCCVLPTAGIVDLKVLPRRTVVRNEMLATVCRRFSELVQRWITSWSRRTKAIASRPPLLSRGALYARR